MMGLKYNISGMLPILIAEKTGPHFAVGDTCFSHEEDLVTYNPDGKQMVAKENDFSKLRNSEPEKAYKGSFNIRVSPELHKQAAICAMAQQVSLNTLVEDALREYVAERKEAV